MRYFSLLLLSFLCTCVSAQTILGPGDMAVTELKLTSSLDEPADNQEASFVLLKDCVAGTKFVVTDREFINGSIQVNNPNNNMPDEGTVEITFGAAAPCGTQFTLSVQRRLNQSPIVGVSGGGSPSITGGNSSTFTLASNGDGVLVFQDNNPEAANPDRFITAANNSGEPFGGNTSVPGASDLPTGLTVGLNAIAFPTDNTESDTEFDNVYYNCSTTTGTPSQISGAVNTVSNWVLTNNQANSFTTCNFTCQAACTDPVLNALNVSLANSCPGTPVTLTVDGSLNDATQWQLRTGSCTGPIVQTTTSNTFPSQVNPDNTTSYFVTVTNCTNQTLCQQGTVTRAVAGAGAGADIRTNGTSATLGANTPTGSSTGQWSIISGDGNGNIASPSAPNSGFTGTAGQSYVLRWTISGGGCPPSNDEVEVSFLAPSTLAVGDVAFTGYDIRSVVSYSFVFLREVNAGTTFNITDKGWLGTALRSGENVASFTTDRSYSCGSEIVILQDFLGGSYRAEDAAGRAAGAFALTTGSPPGFSSIGDQLFAFQGSVASPNFLAGIDVSDDGWDANPTDNASNSALPMVLANNNAAIEIPGEPNAGKYNCSVVNTNPELLKQAINTPVNWNTNETGVNLMDFCGFSCAACDDPTLTAVTASPASSCPGVDVTLTIDGSLMSANGWRLHEGSVANPILQTTMTNTFMVNPGSTTTYVVSVVNCDNSVASQSVTVNREASAANITLDKPVTKVAGTTANLTAAAATGGQTAVWTLVSGTDNNGVVNGSILTGSAGQAYTVRLTLSGGACPTTTDETTVSFLLDGTLALGDLMFTGYNAQAAQEFSLLVNTTSGLPAGERFSVTDNGWSDANGLSAAELTATYLTCLPLSCGDEIIFNSDGTVVTADGTVVASLDAGSFPAINSNGDQLFVYDGGTPPNVGDQTAFIAAIQLNCEGGNCSAANWDGDRIDNTSSAKPDIFDNTNAFLYTGETNPRPNAKFDCGIAVGQGRDAKLLALSNPANWNFRENPAYDLTAVCETFACCTPGTIANLASDVNNVCPGTEVTISFDGTLNDSDEWLVSSGMCDGTFVATLMGNGPKSFTVSPTSTTTYYIRAEGLGAGGCPAATCSEISITVANTVTAVCQGFVVEIDADGDPVFSPDDLDGGSSSSCSLPLSFSVDQNLAFDCSDVNGPAQTVTLTVMDNAGGSDNCTSQVTVEDNVAPTGDCNNIAVDLNSNGTIQFFTSSAPLLGIIGDFQDNCATEPVGPQGGTDFIFDCSNLGINNELYGFRDGNGQEAVCRDVLVQINDPLNVCGPGALVANCQNFEAVAEQDGTYLLDANSLNDGSVADRGLYTLVFDPATDRQENLTQDCQSTDVGQGQTFTAGQDGAIQTIRVRSLTSVSTTLHIYEGRNGSGSAGAVGAPVYSQAVELFASPTGSLTEMLLTTPYPVTAGDEYTFILEGTTSLTYSCVGSLSYDGGRPALNYVGATGAASDVEDYTFQIDIIGPTMQLLTEAGEYPLAIYAVDNQGNISDAACEPTFTLLSDVVYNMSTDRYYTTIAAAILDLPLATSTDPAETIILAPGDYAETLDFSGRKVNLKIGELPPRTP